MAADLIIRMFGLIVSGTNQDSLMSIDIPQDAVIESILMGINPTGMDALDDQCRFEISFGSASLFALNDGRISIAEITLKQQFLTTGGGVGMGSQFLGGVNIPVAAGERIHGHVAVSTGVNGQVFAYLYLDTRGRGPARRSLRRR